MGFERDYHLLLKDFRLHGEWFDLSKENVENVIEWIKDDFDNATAIAHRALNKLRSRLSSGIQLKLPFEESV